VSADRKAAFQAQKDAAAKAAADRKAAKSKPTQPVNPPKATPQPVPPPKDAGPPPVTPPPVTPVTPPPVTPVTPPPPVTPPTPKPVTLPSGVPLPDTDFFRGLDSKNLVRPPQTEGGFKGFGAPSGKPFPTAESIFNGTAFNKGGKVGGRRGDGIAQRGYTKGRLR
jgi:hypothetical protein